VTEGPFEVPALARLGPREVRSAAALVQDGRVWDLALDLDAAFLPPLDPRFGQPVRRVDLVTPEAYRAAFSSGDAGFHLDAVGGSVHQGTHIDGLVHIVHGGRVFGGAAEADIRGPDGWRQHGAETIPPIVGRGVLIDVVAARGGEPLGDSVAIGVDQLAAATEAQAVDLRPGDIVLVRTGKTASLPSDREHFLDRWPGISVDAAVWLAKQGMVAFGSDSGTEPQPVADWSRTVHVELLMRRGIHLLEWLDLAALAGSGRHDFLFVAAPLKVRGASGAWLRPIAVT
jgi:kynurenine formamidase